MRTCHLPKIRVLTLMSTRICTHLKTHSIHFVSQLTIYWFPVKIVLPLNTIAGMMWIKINLKLQQLLKFFFKFIHFYEYWCFAYMHVCVRMPNPLELKLQTVVSYHVGPGN